MQLHHFLLTIPGQPDMTFMGGPLIDDGADHVWLANPRGEKIMRVPRKYVHASTRKETEARLKADFQDRQEGN